MGPTNTLVWDFRWCLPLALKPGSLTCWSLGRETTVMLINIERNSDDWTVMFYTIWLLQILPHNGQSFFTWSTWNYEIGILEFYMQYISNTIWWIKFFMNWTKLAMLASKVSLRDHRSQQKVASTGVRSVGLCTQHCPCCGAQSDERLNENCMTYCCQIVRIVWYI